MARVNVPGVPLVRADALAPVTRGTVLVADPARRTASGRRTWRPADFVPPLDGLVAAAGICQRRGAADVERPYRHAHDLVVSTAPGLDPALVPWAAEVELVSLDGRVREAALWSAGLATTRRRATVLSTRGPGLGGHRRRGRRLPGGPGGRVDRRPRRRRRARRARAPVRRAARAVARRRAPRLPHRRRPAAGHPGVPGARARPLQREDAAHDPAPRARWAASRSSCAGSTSTRTPCGPVSSSPARREATVVLARLETGPEAYVCEAYGTLTRGQARAHGCTAGADADDRGAGAAG